MEIGMAYSARMDFTYRTTIPCHWCVEEGNSIPGVDITTWHLSKWMPDAAYTLLECAVCQRGLLITPEELAKGLIK